MAETWMRPNTRVLWFMFAMTGLVLVAGLVVAYLAQAGGAPLALVGRSVGLLVAAVALVALLGTGRRLRSARLAFDGGYLVVNLGGETPARVPVELVECFFLGHGPSLLRGAGDREGPLRETATVVVRLAERAVQWQQRKVAPALGSWCDGYITIRGTWSEPITVELVRRLNARLVDRHRQLRHQRERSGT